MEQTLPGLLALFYVNAPHNPGDLGQEDMAGPGNAAQWSRVPGSHEALGSTPDHEAKTEQNKSWLTLASRMMGVFIFS